MFQLHANHFIGFDYVNWEGLAGYREAKVLEIFFGSTDFHKEEQWLMKAWDMDKQAERIFAMKEMRNVRNLR